VLFGGERGLDGGTQMVELLDKQSLTQLGAGKGIATVCRGLGITRAEFDRRWKATIAARVPAMSSQVLAPLTAPCEIQRDKWGIPHIYAANDCDLYFGLGFAMAQDRLFQLDYLRRKGSGRLSEILGKSSLDLDVIARTVGLN